MQPPASLVESPLFLFTKSLLGSPEESDEALIDLTFRICHSPRSFPIARLPDIRVAEDGMIAVFFRIAACGKVEGLWLVENRGLASAA